MGLVYIALHNESAARRFQLPLMLGFWYQGIMADSEKERPMKRPTRLADVNRWLGEEGARSAAMGVLRKQGFSADSDFGREPGRGALAMALTAAEDWLEEQRSTEGRDRCRVGLRAARRLVEGA